jgi:broad specificity phosphatase PhoE
MINELVDSGINRIVLLMRHSAREYAEGKHDLLNPLTDEGRDLSRELGRALPKSLRVRGYTSPAERCIETAALVMTGHQEAGGEILRNRVIEALGVFYVLDQMKMYMAMKEAGSLTDFLQAWFDGRIAADILMPPNSAASILARMAAEKLDEVQLQPQLDLMVSHDFTVYTVRDRIVGQSVKTFPEVKYLDALALYKRDGETFIQSHHGEAVRLNAPLPD